MHKSEIPAAARERMARRTLKPVVIDPRKTAHVVIDLQVGFLAPGAISEVAAARDTIPNVNAISQALRAAGGLNAFVRFTIDPDEPQRWTAWYERMPEEMLAVFAEAFKVDGEAWPLWPELDVQGEDCIVNKTRLSAFIPGTCPLGEVLAERGIDTLIVTGTLTNMCCESTVRDAMQMGYKVLFVEDGNATWDDEAHNAALANIATVFAEVITAEEAVRRIEAAGRQDIAA
jgi:ureidoacrylate peracid hydrolase